MSRRVMVIALAIGAIAAGSAATAVRVVDAPAARVDSGSLVLHLRSVLVAQGVVKDVAPVGTSSPGDVIRMRDTLLNLLPQLGRERGARVGTDEATLTILPGGRVRIVGSATLPDGVIRIRGIVSGSIETVPVVGGTGRYLGARGRLVVKDGAAAGVAVNVYQLRLPKTLTA